MADAFAPTVSLISELCDRTMRLRSEDAELGFDEVIDLPLDSDQLGELWLLALAWKTAANRLEKLIGGELADRLSEANTTVEVAGQLIFYKPTSAEKCVDPDGFNNWLAQNPDMIATAFNPNTARKGSLPPAVRQTFFEKIPGVKPVLQPVPIEVLEQHRQAKENR